MPKVKKIPQRQCVGCREMKDKKSLLRVVRSPEGQVSLDFGGKKPGRGAYVCHNVECLRKARKTRALERAFEVTIPPEVYDAMEADCGRKPSEGSGQPPRREGGRDFRSQQGKPPYGKRPYDKERRACGSGEERGPRKPYAERTASQGHRSRDCFSNSHSPGGGRSSGRTAPYAHSRPVKKGKGSFRKREG